MKYLNLYEQFNFNEEDFDWDETPDIINPYDLNFPVYGIVNDKWNKYCDLNSWNHLIHYTNTKIKIIGISRLSYTDLNGGFQKSKDCYTIEGRFFPFDSVNIIK